MVWCESGVCLRCTYEIRYEPLTPCRTEPYQYQHPPGKEYLVIHMGRTCARAEASSLASSRKMALPALANYRRNPY